MLEIPGYYYDAEKARYFKIENTSTAAASSSYSADAVKRRKTNDEASQAERSWVHVMRKHIKRNPLALRPLEFGLRNREFGLGPAAERGRGSLDHAELAAQAWAAGVVDKGSVLFRPTAGSRVPTNVPCFYVGPSGFDDDVGVVFSTVDGRRLVGSYLPTDGDNNIRIPQEIQAYGRNVAFCAQSIACPDVSSIKYHEPTNKLLVTGSGAGYCCGLYNFNPPLDGRYSESVDWAISALNQGEGYTFHGRGDWTPNSLTVAPASSDHICIIGAEGGLLAAKSNATLVWISPNTPPGGVQQGIDDWSGPFPGSIYAQDFQVDNPNIIYAGGRRPQLLKVDIRAPLFHWPVARHASSIAHIRSINPHQVLVAGLQDSMALYDTRFLASEPNGMTPLVTFPEYRNRAHFHVGWDVSPELDVVASAQGDGTVKLFSLSTGVRLKNPGLDAIRSTVPPKGLMFQKLPRERLPSLYIGLRWRIQKFGFGTSDIEDQA